MKEVERHDLPNNLARFADRYEERIGLRDRYVWKWFHRVSPLFRLPTVDPDYRAKVRADKTWLTFYVTMVDDLIDVREDEATFEEATKVPFERYDARINRDDVDEEYLALVVDVWETVERRLTDPPYFAGLRDMFAYDLRQVLNAIRYSAVVNRHPYALNLTEAYAYGSHNMTMFAYADVDLMHSATFDRADLPRLRELLWTAQKMARIGNWISTWRRELDEGDYSSGVVSRAIERGIVAPAELEGDDVQDRIEDYGIERALLEQWHRYEEALRREYELASFDVDEFLERMAEVRRFQLESEGEK